MSFTEHDRVRGIANCTIVKGGGAGETTPPLWYKSLCERRLVPEAGMAETAGYSRDHLEWQIRCVNIYFGVAVACSCTAWTMNRCILINLYLLGIPQFRTHMQCLHLYERWRSCSFCCSACSSLLSTVKVTSYPLTAEKDIQMGVLILSFPSSISNTHTHTQFMNYSERWSNIYCPSGCVPNTRRLTTW